MNKRRVVITGMGAVTPLGNDLQSSWQGILAGKSGVGLLENFDTENYACKFAAQVKNFDPSAHISGKEAKKMDMFIQYGVIAGIEAMQDSGLEVTDELAPRVGVAVGSGIGGLGGIEFHHSNLVDKGPRKLSPFFIPSVIINMVSGHLSIKFNCRGPNISLVSACTTGTHNIGYAARTIQYGDADVMLAGGAEKASTPLGIGGFSALKALSFRNDSPQTASRPFDRNRDGFVLGDGAGVVVLEEYEHAKKRGAKIYAEVTGFGNSGDAYHMTLPKENGQGAIDCMSNAVRDSALSLEQIHYVNAHGTSTPANDKTETLALKTVFGEHAHKMAISSTKSMIGHSLGAAGAIEAILTAMAIKEQVAPGTMNYQEPDPDCDLDYVPNEARQMKIEHAISNSFGFGGTNASLILSRI